MVLKMPEDYRSLESGFLPLIIWSTLSLPGKIFIKWMIRKQTQKQPAIPFPSNVGLEKEVESYNMCIAFEIVIRHVLHVHVFLLLNFCLLRVFH